MMLVKDHDAVLRSVEDVILRELTHPWKVSPLLSMVMLCRYRIIWRANLHSTTALQEIWAAFETLVSVDDDTKEESGMTTDVILQLVNEWLFRVHSIEGFTLDGMASDLADSYLWTSSASTLPESIVRFTGSREDVIKCLKDNPWVIFMMLLGMTDCIRLIEETVKNSKATAPATT